MADRRYSKTHEWITVDGKTATVGISDFAQAQLGDVVFLDLPKPGRKGEASSLLRQINRFDVHRHVRALTQLAGQRLELSPRAGGKH